MAQLDALRATHRRPVNINPHVHEVLPFHVPEIDRKLVGGGLAFGCLHEIMGAGAKTEDAIAAALFLAGALGRTKGKILWYLSRRDLFAPAMHRVGLDTTRVIFVETGDEKKVLACMENALSQGGVTAVVGELGRLTMNESRRLQLAAEKSGAMGVVLRRQSNSHVDTQREELTASRTQWRVSASALTASMPSIIDSHWRLELMRCREGEHRAFQVLACDGEGHITLLNEHFCYPTVHVHPHALN